MNFHSLVKASPAAEGLRSWASGPARALLASCALHFVLFWPSLPSAPAQLSKQNLAATLRTAPREQGAPAPTLRSPSVAATKSNTIAPPRPVPPAQSSVASAIQAIKAAAVSQRGNEVNLDSVDGDAIRDFRIALGRSALAHLRYPAQAQQQGWTGRAEVRIAMSEQGFPQDIALAHTSGHPDLDNEALETLRRAAARTPLPAALHGRAFVFDLPVVFELAD